MGNGNLAAGALALAWIVGGCTPASTPTDAAAAPRDVFAPQLDSLPPEPDAPIPLGLVAISPGHGAFAGGDVVMLRGSRFPEGAFAADCASRGGCASVTFDGEPVTDATWVDAHRVEVIVPPGAPGVVDVVLTVPEGSVTLAGGWTYDAIAVRPPIGSIAGGTLVEIERATGTFGAGDVVTFDGAACTDLSAAGAFATCRTPAHASGAVAVSVPGLGGTGDAYRYLEPLVEGGGFDGGPIDGSIDVTVIDAVFLRPVVDAFVLVGDDPAGLSGRTDSNGRITLATPGLAGPLDLHVALRCYETASFLAIDARRVTALVPRRLDGPCMEPLPGAGNGRNAAVIEGEIVWTGAAWADVPAPAFDEARVAMVYTTRTRPDVLGPDPGAGGMSRVSEGGGSTFRIASRPGTLAVYALAGLEGPGGVFRPYVMGIARGLVALPGETQSGVEIPMDLTLGALEVAAAMPPGGTSLEVRACPVIGEGAIVDGFPYPVGSSSSPIDLGAWPPLEGSLADARYTIRAQWSASDPAIGGSTWRVITGASPEATVTLDDFLGFATTEPPAGDPLPADRRIRWSIAGSPDFVHAFVYADTGQPVARVYAPGSVTSFELLDLSTIRDVDPVPTGTLFLYADATRIPGFSWSRFRFRQVVPDEVASHATHFETNFVVGP